MRGCIKSAVLAATGLVGESPLFLVDYLIRLLRVAILLTVWRTIMHGRQQMGGMTLSNLLTYTVISEAFAGLLSGQTDISSAFWDGRIVMRYLRPLGIFAQFNSEALGLQAIGLLLFSAPLILLAPLAGVNPLPASPAAAVLFLISLTLSVGVGFALDYLFCGLAVGFELHHYAVSRVSNAVGAVASGALVPLALMPGRVGSVLGWLPFAAMASAPLRIYTGTGSPGRLIATQAFWCAVLWPLLAWYWRAIREKVVSHGG